MTTERKEFIDGLKATIDVWNAKIEKLEAEVKVAEAENRRELQTLLQQMRDKRDDAAAQLNQAEAASEESWKDIKSGIQAAWNDLSSAMDKAMSRWT